MHRNEGSYQVQALSLPASAGPQVWLDSAPKRGDTSCLQATCVEGWTYEFDRDA